ncbi:MAG: prepilin-type N-terminal cleavage/methylation domain-containing protein [Deltaproteobacteria bacterium]|nr:prepilin-type N-terminal cleavage/methylation domain-containing protein [Deltaproteobacteria bacterium]
MNASCRKLLRTVKNRDGFTLIEMLIVIIILGILAMVIIPQITVSTEDAKVSTLKANLGAMRSAIEVYYAQHNMTYPGVNAAGGTYGLVGTKEAFTSQLTMYSNSAGTVATAYSASTTDPAANFVLGPYIKGGTLPANPFNNKVDVLYDVDVVDITNVVGLKRAAGGTTGWKYLSKFGVLFANDESSATTVDTPHKQY